MRHTFCSCIPPRVHQQKPLHPRGARVFASRLNECFILSELYLHHAEVEGIRSRYDYHKQSKPEVSQLTYRSTRVTDWRLPNAESSGRGLVLPTFYLEMLDSNYCDVELSSRLGATSTYGRLYLQAQLELLKSEALSQQRLARSGQLPSWLARLCNTSFIGGGRPLLICGRSSTKPQLRRIDVCFGGTRPHADQVRPAALSPMRLFAGRASAPVTACDGRPRVWKVFLRPSGLTRRMRCRLPRTRSWRTACPVSAGGEGMAS